MFREHIAWGALAAMAIVVCVYFYALITDPWLLLFLFGIAVVGSFLPDVDSDSGMPFYLVFGGATIAATGVVLLYTLASPYAESWKTLIGIPAVALVFVWFIVGGILKRFTRHRGIFHSIPALAIASTATYLAAHAYGLSDTTALIYGAAMGIGFATHLVLDEMHALVSFDGIPFFPKESLGTALKLFSKSGWVNLATFSLLGVLVYTAYHQVM